MLGFILPYSHINVRKDGIFIVSVLTMEYCFSNYLNKGAYCLVDNTLKILPQQLNISTIDNNQTYGTTKNSQKKVSTHKKAVLNALIAKEVHIRPL